MNCVLRSIGEGMEEGGGKKSVITVITGSARSQAEQHGQDADGGCAANEISGDDHRLGYRPHPGLRSRTMSAHDGEPPGFYRGGVAARGRRRCFSILIVLSSSLSFYPRGQSRSAGEKRFVFIWSTADCPTYAMRFLDPGIPPVATHARGSVSIFGPRKKTQGVFR